VASAKQPADSATRLTAADGPMKALSSNSTTRSSTATPGAVARKNQSAAHVSRGKAKPGATSP
jgi:hypothetical protein